jgi:hypothetical protein
MATALALAAIAAQRCVIADLIRREADEIKQCRDVAQILAVEPFEERLIHRADQDAALLAKVVLHESAWAEERALAGLILTAGQIDLAHGASDRRQDVARIRGDTLGGLLVRLWSDRRVLLDKAIDDQG